MDWNTHHPLSRKKTAIMTQAFGFGPSLTRLPTGSQLASSELVPARPVWMMRPKRHPLHACAGRKWRSPGLPGRGFSLDTCFCYAKGQCALEKSASVGFGALWLPRYSRRRAMALSYRGSSLYGLDRSPDFSPVLRTPLPGASFCLGFARRPNSFGDCRPIIASSA